MSDPFYGTQAWKNLARKVRARDGYRCTLCGVDVRKKYSGHVDHIIPLKQRPDLAMDMSNLTTLCAHHHNSTKQREERRGEPQPVINADGYPPDWQ